MRTTNRQPFSVSIKNIKSNFFNHTDFKGLCDNKNNIAVNQHTFSDVKNVYINDSGTLTSRPSFKFYDGEAHIVDEWFFGTYGLRLHRIQTQMKYNDTNEIIKDELGTPIEYFCFILRCVSHETIQNPAEDMHNEMQWYIPIDEVGYNFLPKVILTQVEDKIYIWFAGVDFICFNTSGYYDLSNDKNYPYFEDAAKYIYLPVHKQVTNGIENILETKNFLTETYRKRYLYNALSTVNFEKLVNREMTVYLNSDETINKSKHLYDITVQKKQDKMLIYPFSPLGNNYHIDVVQTARATVTLRYSISLHTIELSFDGKFFRPLPELENIVGNPQLSKDGMWVLAFTTKGLGKCRLVAQETSDFLDIDSILTWDVEAYMPKVIINGFQGYITEIDTDFIPVGYFETIDQYAYIIKEPNNSIPFLYTQWLSGVNEIWSYYPLSTTKNNITVPWFRTGEDLQLHFKYVEPTVTNRTAANVVSIMAKYFHTINESGTFINKTGVIANVFFENVTGEDIDAYYNRYLTQNDYLRLGKITDPSSIEDVQGYITALTSYNDKQAMKIRPGTIYHNDIVLITEYSTQTPISQHYANLVYSYDLGVTMYQTHIDLKTYYSTLKDGIRYKIERLDGKTGPISPFDPIKLTSIDYTITHTATEMQELFGDFPKDPTDTHNTTWEDVLGTFWGITDDELKTTYKALPGTFCERSGTTMMSGIKNIAENISNNITDLVPSSTVLLDGVNYTYENLSFPCYRMDLKTIDRLDAGNILYDIKACYSLYAENASGKSQLFDMLLSTSYNYKTGTYINKTINQIGISSQYFKLASYGTTYLTDKYLYIDNEKIFLPTNGELSESICDQERNLNSNDNFIITAQNINNDDIYKYDRNIHKLTPNGNEIASGIILSGDTVSYTKDANSESDFLSSSLNKFIVNKVNDIGTIKIGDLIQLVAMDSVYPPAPIGWTGTEWPTTEAWKGIEPVYIVDGEIHFWEAGDTLPVGPIQLVGYAGINKKIKPLNINDTGIWYSIDGTLWTSKMSSSALLEIDEIVNAKTTLIDGKRLTLIDFCNDVPNYIAKLNETYLSFKTIEEGKNLLQVTSVRRDENKIFVDGERDLLLYLPKINEQQFSRKITNLHALSEDTMGVFLEDEIWYIKYIINNTVVDYTAPIKSKLPIGCRDGSEIITALDGSTIIFTTTRGITALAPKDFIASKEQTINYLSDNIQNTYRKFYEDNVFNSMFMPNEFEESYSPLIKIRTYKYWILFYRYMDRVILALDTRNGSWWKWYTPYPIRSITVGTKLHVLMQLDFSLIKNNILYSPPPQKTLLGVSYILSDLNETKYSDNIVENALNGYSELVYENEMIGSRRVLHYAKPIIEWGFTSQRLHFNQINSYKTIKAININAEGMGTQTAKLSNKVFRDLTHPERSAISEININDLRTFVKHLNLMHVMNFQYKIEVDIKNEEQSQIKINSLSIKYEVKENIR